MTDGERLAHAAERLVGTRFRLHGRDPDLGLDCIGLVAACLRAIGREPVVPEGYRLANRSIEHWLRLAAQGGWQDVSGRPAPGDLVLVHPATTRAHLLIGGSRNDFVHAHAGLRRVVATPAPLPWAIARQWRLAGN